jgi:hypothetical protein
MESYRRRKVPASWPAEALYDFGGLVAATLLLGLLVYWYMS